MLDPIEVTTPDFEVDEFTGKLKKIELQQNSIIYTPVNRKLLYTKAEIDAKLANVSTTPSAFDIEVDKATTYTYWGEAAVGSATSEAKWRIRRILNGGTSVQWINGNSNFTNVWDNRAAGSYS